MVSITTIALSLAALHGSAALQEPTMTWQPEFNMSGITAPSSPIVGGSLFVTSFSVQDQDTVDEVLIGNMAHDFFVGSGHTAGTMAITDIANQNSSSGTKWYEVGFTAATNVEDEYGEFRVIAFTAFDMALPTHWSADSPKRISKIVTVLPIPEEGD